MALTFDGTGTRFYGWSDPRNDGSFVTTEWFTFFYVPLIPIRSFRGRVDRTESMSVGYVSSVRYDVIEKLDIQWAQVGSIYAFIGLSCAWWVEGFWLLFTKIDPLLPEESVFTGIIAVLIGGLPFAFVWWSRRRLKKTLSISAGGKDNPLKRLTSR